MTMWVSLCVRNATKRRSRAVLCAIFAVAALVMANPLSAPSASARPPSCISQDDCYGTQQYAMVLSNFTNSADAATIGIAGIGAPGRDCLSDSGVPYRSFIQAEPQRVLPPIGIAFEIAPGTASSPDAAPGTSNSPPRYGQCTTQPGCSERTGFVYRTMLAVTEGTVSLNGGPVHWKVPATVLAGCALNARWPVSTPSEIPVNAMNFYDTRREGLKPFGFLPCLDKLGNHNTTDLSTAVGLNQQGCAWDPKPPSLTSQWETWPGGQPWFGLTTNTQSDSSLPAYGTTITTYSANGYGPDAAGPSYSQTPTQNCYDMSPVYTGCVFIRMDGDLDFTPTSMPDGVGPVPLTSLTRTKTAQRQDRSTQSVTKEIKRFVKRVPRVGKPTLTWDKSGKRLVVSVMHGYSGLSTQALQQRQSLNLLSLEAQAVVDERQPRVAGSWTRLPRTVKGNWQVREMVARFSHRDSVLLCHVKDRPTIDVFPRQTIITESGTHHFSPSYQVRLRKACNKLPSGRSNNPAHD